MRAETLDIPADIRFEAYVRDLGFCRMCGKYLGERCGLHHIRYGGDVTGMGGRRLHTLDNVVTLCWLPGDPAFRAQPCHARAHASKGLWQPLLLTVVQRPGVTAFQLRRWSANLVRPGADTGPAGP